VDIEALETGIYNKFIADADLLAALGGNTARRMYNTEAPQDPSYPYCVFQYISGVPDPTFTSDGEILQYQFSIYHKSDDPLDKTTIDDAFTKLCACYDDASLTVSGYSSIGVTRGVSNPVPTVDDTQQYVINYEIMIEET
jgi:hypothetical protein